MQELPRVAPACRQPNAPIDAFVDVRIAAPQHVRDVGVAAEHVERFSHLLLPLPCFVERLEVRCAGHQRRQIAWVQRCHQQIAALVGAVERPTLGRAERALGRPCAQHCVVIAACAAAVGRGAPAKRSERLMGAEGGPVLIGDLLQGHHVGLVRCDQIADRGHAALELVRREPQVERQDAQRRLLMIARCRGDCRRACRAPGRCRLILRTHVQAMRRQRLRRGLFVRQEQRPRAVLLHLLQQPVVFVVVDDALRIAPIAPDPLVEAALQHTDLNPRHGVVGLAERPHRDDQPSCAPRAAPRRLHAVEDHSHDSTPRDLIEQQYRARRAEAAVGHVKRAGYSPTRHVLVASVDHQRAARCLHRKQLVASHVEATISCPAVPIRAGSN
eukprot:1020097-Prymnesium_polylepis.1